MHSATRRASELKGRLQRINPVEETELYNRTFADLIRMEATIRAFRDDGINGL